MAFVNCYNQDSPAAAREDEALSKVKGQRMRMRRRATHILGGAELNSTQHKTIRNVVLLPLHWSAETIT